MRAEWSSASSVHRAAAGARAVAGPSAPLRRRPPGGDRPRRGSESETTSQAGVVHVVLVIVGYRPGITDDQLAFAIFGRRRADLVVLECKHLVEIGELDRRRRKDGLIGNYCVQPAC